MTSLSENICTNEINRNSEEDEFEKVQSTEIREILDNHEKQDKFEQNDVNEDLIEEENDNKITNGFSSDDALINTSPSIVNSDNHQVKEVKEITVNHDNDEQRSKKLFNSKIKHSSMPYQRSAYYINDHSYGAVPYYYYQHQQSLPIPMDKPAPLMFLSAETSTSPSREISTSVSPQNLPPRLRQTSTTEYDTNSPPPPITTTTTTSSSSTTTTTTTKIHTSRRHRTILPHTSNSFLPHPPPLMATPPGVLYSYPHAVHPSGPIAYSIRPPDELELLAFQQQMMNLPPGTMLWPPPGHPHFPPYPISGLVPPPPSAFFPNHTSIPEQQANSFLNPEAAEWIPPTNENDTSSNDQILIDDEINFPPLNSTVNHIQTSSTNNKDSLEYTSAQQQQQQIDHSSEVPSTTPDEQSSISIDNSHISNSKTELPITPPSSLSSSSSSSQDDHNTKPLSSSPVKLTPLNYSTILSQTIENNKLRKTNSIQQRSQQTTNHIHNQLPQKDRTTKQQQKLQMNSSSTSDSNSRRRQPFHKHNNTNRINTRNLLTSELNSPSKPQLTTPELVDDWIEVKSKKTKKFDRITNDYSNEKSFNDEQNTKSFSSTLSLTSTNENTTPTTFTSEDDFDEKDNRDRRLITNTTISNDYNRTLIDDIHRRLEKNERLLIIMRGCPGSGKSTLAKLLNNGYNGVVLSADDYFTDTILNTYTFDSTKLDDAHRSIRQRASDAFKRNLSPIIIDNTNTQAWEMKPYVAMGKEAGYDILLVEPQTPWRYKARELFKRNTHNLPIRRIKDMLTRFEHHLTVQNLLDQISSSSKSISSPSIQQNHIQDSENLDSNHLSKRTYDIVDDSSILNDVRLCINDMILFLTSNFYQTTRSSSSQSSTSLSVSFHDLSLISSTPSSIPSTPTTPHARFPRTFTRFPSTNQDHSFNSEHLLRLPTSAFIRPIETNHLTSTLSVQSKLSEKKRKKNKTKQPTNDLLLNMNNNNNNNNSNRIIKGISIENIQEETYQVLLPEDCLDFVVIDELNDKDSISNSSSSISHSSKQLINPKSSKLVNIIHSELIKPSYSSSVSTKHIGIQCSSNDFTCPLNNSDLILIGHLSNEIIEKKSLPIRIGFNECGIQVDLHENNLNSLIQTYSNRLSIDMIEQFYEICHFDSSWTCLQIDEYLLTNVHHSQQQLKIIPTLRQLTLEKLNQWNEQIKSTDPSFDTHSMDDLLQDINDEDIFENIHSNQIHIPWSIVNSVEEIYGELPNKSILISNDQGLLLPCDDQLTVNIYHALQRFLMKTNQTTKPVRKINQNQKWKSPIENQSNSSQISKIIPSFRQIMDEEEQQAVLSQKSKQKQQLDYVTEHKFKELQRQFSSLDRDLLFDIFRENEYDYDLTFVCLSTMFDENISLPIRPKSVSSNSPSICNSNPVEPVVDSYENLRCNALRHAQKRKEFYIKAQQANHHGMFGVASYYIHCASEQTQLMKNANRTACERLSRWRLKEFYQTQKLDLHGLHADEALNLFKQIEQEYNEKNRRTTPKTIEIITGYGKNSIYGGGYGKIRSVISTYLQQRNYKYSEANKGVLLLQF